MPERLPDNTRHTIMIAFLKGEARDSIAARLNVSTGAVSNVVEEFTTTRVGHEIDALRHLAVRLRKLEPEEVQRLIEVATLREKAMIAMLATSGMRIGTLLSLRYRHVRKTSRPEGRPSTSTSRPRSPRASTLIMTRSSTRRPPTTSGYTLRGGGEPRRFRPRG
jgi:integrase